MDIFAKIGLINCIIAAFFGAQVLVRNRKDTSNRTFVFLAFSIAFWSFSYWQWLSSVDEDHAFLWVKLLTLGSTLIPVFYFIWSVSLVGLSKRYRSVSIGLVAISLVFILLTFFTDLVVRGLNQRLIFPFWPTAGPLYGIYITLIYVGLVGWGLSILIRAFRNSTDRGLRSQIFYIWIGSLIGFGGGATNFFLWYGVMMPPYLNIFSSIGLVLFYYAASKYKLFNVKIIATQFFADLLIITATVRLVFSNSLEDFIINGAVLVLIIIFGYLLARSTLVEVEQKEELERLDKQLEEKNAQLDELSHFKSELLSLASHQIRSPLAAMKGFMSLIMDGTYGTIDPRAKEALGKTQRSAEELIGLINTLLDVRKVEEGKMEYSFAKTDMRKMAQDVFALLEPLAVTKKLEFKLTVPDHEVFVNADAEKLKQVVQNLTDNAIKYTPSGFVHMELKEEIEAGAAGAPNGARTGTATLTVSDSGYGISAELVPHLFEEFMRDEKVKKLVRGTGLGLFIARKIAEAHGGKIWAESEGEGKGSAFHLSVPIVKFAPDAPVPAANAALAAAPAVAPAPTK